MLPAAQGFQHQQIHQLVRVEPADEPAARGHLLAVGHPVPDALPEQLKAEEMRGGGVAALPVPFAHAHGGLDAVGEEHDELDGLEVAGLGQEEAGA